MKNPNGQVVEPQAATTESARHWIPAVFVLLWSSGAIFVEFGLRDAGPFSFLFLRFLAVVMILAGICLWIKVKWPETKAEWRDAAVSGVFMQAGYQVFFFMALAYEVSPGLLAIILGAQPILTTLWINRRVGGGQWAGLVLGLLGLVFVVSHSLYLGTISWIGIACAVLSLVSITVGTAWQKRVTLSLPMNLTIQSAVGAVLLVIPALAYESFDVKWSMMFAVSLAWMVLVISVGASLLLFLMIRRGNLTNVTGLFYCVPPVTALLDYLIFGQAIYPETLVGMLCIVIGIVLINRQGKLV